MGAFSDPKGNRIIHIQIKTIMRTYLKSTALLISMNFAGLISADASVRINGIDYQTSGETATVTGCDQKIQSADIPAAIQIEGKDYTVVNIQSRAFFNCEMNSVTIPPTVEFIGEKAFYGCKGLTELDIPNSVTVIQDNAFEKCTSIERLSISSSLSVIAERTFYECYALSSVMIPPSVSVIGKSAFYNCTSMQSLSIPTSVRQIDEFAFYGCDHLPSVTIPSSVEKIGVSAFWNCSSLKSATIPSSVKEIPDGIFYGCKSLTDVIIPSSVTTIGERAFEQCLVLPVIVLPPSVTEIGESAFKNCEKLSTIVSYPPATPTVDRNTFYRVPADAVIYVPAEALGEYPAAEGWNAFHDFRALGSVDLAISSSELNLQVGENATLTVSVNKAYDVAIQSEAWTTSNPYVAAVDNGVVTAVGEGSATISFTVIDGTGCPHSAYCDIFVDGIAGTDNITDGNNSVQTEYYNLKGIRVNHESLAPGLYIKKEGKSNKKILIK